MLVWIFHPKTIGALLISKYAVQKPVALPLQHAADTFNIYEVGAKT